MAKVEAETPEVAIGQVWESTESRDKGRKVRVVSVSGGYANCTGVDGNLRATRLDVSRMNARGHWRLVTVQGIDYTPPFSDGESLVPYDQQRPIAVSDYLWVGSLSLSLAPGKKPTHEQFSKDANTLRVVNKGVAFWIGDMLNLGESLFSEEMSQHLDEFGLDEKSVKVYGWVAKNVPEENRRIAPTFGHAQAVAALKPPAQRKWLEKTVEGDWKIARLKMEIVKAGEGHSSMRFFLIVDCITEARQEKLQQQLEADGFSVTVRSGLKRSKKVKAKRGKKEVTARARRPSKMNTRRRTPTSLKVVH